jgi:hypothetical protein
MTKQYSVTICNQLVMQMNLGRCIDRILSKGGKTSVNWHFSSFRPSPAKLTAQRAIPCQPGGVPAVRQRHAGSSRRRVSIQQIQIINLKLKNSKLQGDSYVFRPSAQRSRSASSYIGNHVAA